MNITNINNYIECLFTDLDKGKIQYLRQNYVIIDVDYLDKHLVNFKMINNEFFDNSFAKKETVNKMLDFYLNDKDKNIYKKTDYLCNEKEQVCICNTNANNFRKIYEGINYKPDQKYISWCKEVF